MDIDSFYDDFMKIAEALNDGKSDEASEMLRTLNRLIAKKKAKESLLFERQKNSLQSTLVNKFK